MGLEDEVKSADRVWLCPWDDCEWEYVEQNTEPVLGTYYGVGDPLSDIVESLVDVSNTEDVLRAHMDETHAGWTVEELEEHSRRNVEKLDRAMREK